MSEDGALPNSRPVLGIVLMLGAGGGLYFGYMAVQGMTSGDAQRLVVGVSALALISMTILAMTVRYNRSNEESPPTEGSQ